MCYNHIQNFMSKPRLLELLDRAGMTKEDLADRLNVPAKAIDAIEQGNYDPPLSFAYKLAAELKIPVERLFTD
jgi:putative transcriptional regulator